MKRLVEPDKVLVCKFPIIRKVNIQTKHQTINDSYISKDNKCYEEILAEGKYKVYTLSSPFRYLLENILTQKEIIMSKPKFELIIGYYLRKHKDDLYWQKTKPKTETIFAP